MVKKQKQKYKKNLHSGVIVIKATFNNTFVSITDLKGNVVYASSAGACGFKSSKKATAYAAQVVMKKVVGEAVSTVGLKIATVKVNGPGPGRDAVKVLRDLSIDIGCISDETNIPHNGCRPPKKRRV